MRNQIGGCWPRRQTRASLLGCLLALCWFSVEECPAQSEVNGQSPDALHQLSASVEELVSRVSPSVVQVLATGYGATEGADSGETALVIGRLRSIGSGVIVDPEGYILTNAHVIKGAQRVQVTLPSLSSSLSSTLSAPTSRGRPMDARIIGVSRDIDLALLKVEAEGLQALPMGKYTNLRQGQMVLAFGSPGGLQNSVTMGRSKLCRPAT